MKNLFVKENHTRLWITVSITGALAVGAGIWFYLRGKRAAELEASRKELARDYLEDRHFKKKKHKTDVSELGNLVHHAQA
jgi:hypothetical protein